MARLSPRLYRQVATRARDRCEDCGGMWLDLNEIHRVLAIKGEAKRIELATEPKARPGSGRQTRLCPRDGGHMVTLSNLPQVHVEYEQCPICGGIYLDRGELNDLNSYTVLERDGLIDPGIGHNVTHSAPSWKWS